jgi:prolyl-tRNA editing enzyme YbaK/EbsC (Cys-tRNA(Pro) deacylase)
VTDQNALDLEFFSSRQVSKARGGVSPIGWVSDATVLIDLALDDYEVVWAAAGHPHSVFPTTYAELITCTGATPMVVGE